jgi:hypothetical protein
MHDTLQNQPLSPATQGASTTALWLETIFGLFGLLGVGHVYAGRIVLGIALMIGWWIYLAIAAVVITITVGVAACLFMPISLAVPIISGIQARTYIQQKGGAGDWQSVALVTGGGCLLIIAAVILMLVLGVGLGALGTLIEAR